MTSLTRLVEDYFELCSSGSAAQIAAACTDDAVIYDTNHGNHGPVSTAETIGTSWLGGRDRWHGARRKLDAAVEQGGLVAVEWTMMGRRDGAPFRVRGSDHYRFEGGRIAEIHQYGTFRPEGSEMVGYPYGPVGGDAPA